MVEGNVSMIRGACFAEKMLHTSEKSTSGLDFIIEDKIPSLMHCFFMLCYLCFQPDALVHVSRPLVSVKHLDSHRIAGKLLFLVDEPECKTLRERF